jgi:hypothetical protein
MDKKLKMQKLIEDLRNDNSHKNIQGKRQGKLADLSLVNHFAFHSFIPNTWFDWERRVDSPIMIIGQDWGPYTALKKYVDEYKDLKNKKGFDYDSFLLKQFSSRTERFIMNTIRETHEEKLGNFSNNLYKQFFFSMAVLFTRQGTKFRGNELFDEKKSRDISYPYVVRQIEIVKPKVIMTLGNLGFSVVNEYYRLGFKEHTLSEVLAKLQGSHGVIKMNDVVIIPNYHPAAHINPKIQKDIWRKIWDLVSL